MLLGTDSPDRVRAVVADPVLSARSRHHSNLRATPPSTGTPTSRSDEDGCQDNNRVQHPTWYPT